MAALAHTHTGWLSATLQRLPVSWIAALDAWSQRVARERALARHRRGARKVTPLPPVMTGRVYLPHPWRD